MYAIVESRGRQYKVSPGDLIALDLLNVASGETYTFDKVLMLVNDDLNVILDKKDLEKVRVSGVVTKTQKGDKIVIFKYKRRKDYHKKQGHRQSYSLVKIKGIENIE
ncbi:50S ribosomal protein L21 [bacterium]|nr:50S ribosomal protein L21 [bacterium]